MGDEYTSTEHILLGLTDSPESKTLSAFGVTKDAVLKALREIRGSQSVTSQNPEETYQALEKYGRDLTALARQGKMDPVIGRDEEIRRTIEILSRRTKNNPLIGEPAWVRPPLLKGWRSAWLTATCLGLKNKRIVQLDMAAMVAEPNIAASSRNVSKPRSRK